MFKKPFTMVLLIVLALAISSHPDTASNRVHAAQAPKSKNVHKVIAPPGLLDGEMDGVTLLADYGSFALYHVSDRALAGLEPEIKAQVRLADEMDQLFLPPHPFHTQLEPPQIARQMQVAPESSSPGLYVVQFVGPIKAQWLEELRASGAIPLHYVANNAYLVWTDRAGQTRLAAMVRDKTLLQYSTPYHPYYKLGGSIRDQALAPDGSEVAVDVQIYAGATKGTASESVIEYATAQLSPWTPLLDYQNVRLKVRTTDLLALSRLPEVVWIGKYVDPELQDEIQAQIMAGGWSGLQGDPGAPGYLDWLDGYGFSADPDDYPIVDVVDDGVGNGLTDSGDPTLHQLGSTANPTRLAYVTSCILNGDGSGLEGHGHINISIAGGYDRRAGSPYQDDLGYQRGLGINPYGRLASTQIFGPYFDLTNCGGTEANLLRHIQDSGAQIASNSWGCDPAHCPDYDLTSQAFDAGTRDADPSEPGNQELILLVAAGNYGSGSSTVGSPGNAKNVITVGASENVRPDWTDNCNVGPDGADNALDIALFSSRGPAPGGRIKPEVVAPGTHIQGTASTHPTYTGASVCDMYWPAGQTVFASSSGTSHSTPAVAGTASLYYYWLENRYGLSPSPALIKAYLIAHTTYMTGSGANDTLPSNNQGYGMPNMGLAFDDTPRYLVNQSVLLDDSGETWNWRGTIADPTRPVRIVLAYTDKPGFVGSSPPVNNLDLEVEVDADRYLGNVFSGQWSTAGGQPDSLNNYEAVYLPAGNEGALSITVTGFNIADDGVPGTGDGTDQDFALVCYNCLETADFSLRVTPKQQAVCAPDAARYDVEVRRTLDFDIPVALSVSNLPAGALPIFSQNPVIPPGSSQLTIEGTTAFTPGLHALSLVGANTMNSDPPTGTHSIDVQLEVWTQMPGTTTPSQPPDGTAGLATEVELAWEPASQGAVYDLELATDPDFAAPVYTATTTSYSHPVSHTLDYNTTYYWRVTARNTCGQGPASQAFRFTTQPAPLTFCRAPMQSIPDGSASGVSDTLSIAHSGFLFDLDVALTTTHSWVGDLVVVLKNQDTGAEIALLNRPGQEGSDYGCSGSDIRVTLDDEAAYSIQDDCSIGGPAYIDGAAYRPAQALSVFDGQELEGVWTLTIADQMWGDTGLFEAWCLTATVGPNPPLVVDPAEIDSLQLPGEQVSQVLTLTNPGDVALQWQLADSPPWLHVSAGHGLLGAAGSTTLQVTLDATGLAPGVYTTTLRLIKETQQQMVLASIPVTMTVNTPPTATVDIYDTQEDIPLVISAPGMLGNDDDPDGGLLTATVDEMPAAGTLHMAIDGSFVYTPALETSGVFTWTYRAHDPWSASDPATVTIVVTAVDDPPTVTVIPDQIVLVNTVLAPISFSVHDVDSPICSLTVTVHSSNPLLVPADGLLLDGICAERTLTITPTPDVWGRSTITLMAGDGSGVSSYSFMLLVRAEHELYFPLVFR